MARIFRQEVNRTINPSVLELSAEINRRLNGCAFVGVVPAERKWVMVCDDFPKVIFGEKYDSKMVRAAEGTIGHSSPLVSAAKSP
jgi:hypothetical protein